VRARLSEYGVPVDGRAHVHAVVEYPDASTATLAMSELVPGAFEGSLRAGMPGLYRFTVMASGVTFRGSPFTREQLLTAAVFRGGNDPDSNVGGGDLCELLTCLTGDDVATPRFQERLNEWGLDLGALRKCIEAHCAS